MNLLVVLLIVFVLIAILGNPHVGGQFYPGYSFGYWPSGIGLIVVILLVLFLMGRL
jgi:uncharacterized protein DUF3309